MLRSPAPLLALCMTAAPAAGAEDPFDTALELLRHERVLINEALAVSHLRGALSGGIAGQPPAAGSEARSGYRLRFLTGVYTAVPQSTGATGIHGFCADTTGRVCYTEDGKEPAITGSRCSSACRDLPEDWLAKLLPRPALSPARKETLLAALDADPRFKAQPAMAETVRALVMAAAPRAAAAPSRAHEGAVNTLAFTPDGAALVTGSGEKSQATLWSVASRQPLATLSACDGLYKAVVSPGGDMAATSCYRSVKLWTLPDWTPAASFDGFGASLIELSFDETGRTLAAVAEGRTTLWRFPGGRRLASLRTAPPGANTLVSHGVLSPDGTSLVTAGLEEPLQLWSVPGGTRTRALEAAAQDVTVLAISRDGGALAAGYGDGTVALWSLPDGRAIARRREHGFAINGLAFGADGRRLVSASSDGSLRVWALPEGTVRLTLRGHGTEVFAVAVSSRGVIASGDRDGVVLLWDLESGARKGSLGSAR